MSEPMDVDRVLAQMADDLPVDHTRQAAHHLLAVAALDDPTFPRTPEMHEEAERLVEAIVSALLAGRAS